MQGRRLHAGALAAVVLWAVLGGACAAAIDAGAIADAQTVARVKTALVNDPVLGERALEVRVMQGIAEISGRVLSTDELQRAIGIVRAVPGVSGVQAGSVLVGAAPAAPAGAEPLPVDPGAELRELERNPSLLTLGAALSTSRPASDDLSPRWTIGLLIRVGSGVGLGPVVGFNWFRAGVEPGGDSRVRVRPLMGGIGYTVQRGETSIGTSIAAGYAFNSVSRPRGDGRTAVAVDNSWVLRPGVSVWHDLGRRLALNVSFNYVLTELGVTFLEDGRLIKRDISGNTAVIQAGLAYKFF